MSKTNCKSCGGPLNIADPKCPFCGTKNINLTDIDLASSEAANFIFRLPHNITGADGKEVYMSMLAVPELDTIQTHYDYTDVMGLDGDRKLTTFCSGGTLEMGINLRAVASENRKEIYALTIN